MNCRRIRMKSLSAALGLALGVGCVTDVSGGEDPWEEESSEKTLAKTDQALVGGTLTPLHPEIGQYRHPVPGSPNERKLCTATLFTPRYAITAAHCVEYSHVVRGGEEFVVTDLLGNTHRFAVDKIATFSTSSSDSTTIDIAILRLTTPVSSSLATPRPLASSMPAVGTRVSTYGYGCTERLTKTGAGFKRLTFFNYGSKTTALCPGDSGGPAVYGDLLPGEIWGVNSAYDTVIPVQNGADRFGHVAPMKPRIEAMIRQWEAHDYSADGKADLLWHHSAGDVGASALDGSNVAQWLASDWSAAESTGWKVMGSGDFNNDGNSDILWWHPTLGSVGVWLFNGALQVIGTQGVSWSTAASTGWQIVGTGDFNGDGNTDIMWWHGQTGAVGPWHLDGRGNVLSAGRLSWSATAGSNWKPVGTGDFNYDGMMDLLWHNTVSGEVDYWQLDRAGRVKASSRLTWQAAASTGWKVVGTGDYNGDNKMDVLWHHPSSGSISAWFLNGPIVTGTSGLASPVADSSGWKLVGR
jgi:V8-like Glu-specific endopeptidase